MAKYTPMIEQYLKVKEQARDAFLFRLGDFYEMFLMMRSLHRRNGDYADRPRRRRCRKYRCAESLIIPRRVIFSG